MNAIAKAARQRRAAILAALEGLGVVVTVRSEEAAHSMVSSLFADTLCERVERHGRLFQFAGGGSITIAVRS